MNACEKCGNPREGLIARFCDSCYLKLHAPSPARVLSSYLQNEEKRENGEEEMVIALCGIWRALARIEASLDAPARLSPEEEAFIQEHPHD